jgi:hypothetical protein
MFAQQFMSPPYLLCTGGVYGKTGTTCGGLEGSTGALPGLSVMSKAHEPPTCLMLLMAIWYLITNLGGICFKVMLLVMQ